VGCLNRPSPSASARNQRSDSAITYGTADTTHEAVVAILTSQTVCTGTILEVHGSDGFALTAAHCVQGHQPSGIQLIQGDDWQTSTLAYPVVDVALDPSYTAGTPDHDFAMLHFTGATSSTPSLPALPPAEDSIHPGDSELLVGYGYTDFSSNNTRREQVTVSPESVTANSATYSEADGGGGCVGDEGGPALVSVDGGQRVGVVLSSEGTNCTISWVGGRVSAVYLGFIRPFIDGLVSASSASSNSASGSSGGSGSNTSGSNSASASSSASTSTTGTQGTTGTTGTVGTIGTFTLASTSSSSSSSSSSQGSSGSTGDGACCNGLHCEENDQLCDPNICYCYSPSTATGVTSATATTGGTTGGGGGCDCGTAGAHPGTRSNWHGELWLLGLVVMVWRVRRRPGS
jgi:MYXO-CTERM domain-containing protein